LKIWSAAVLGRSNGLMNGRFLDCQRLGGMNVAAPEDGRAPKMDFEYTPWHQIFSEAMSEGF
jgi:hypothetical protein